MFSPLKKSAYDLPTSLLGGKMFSYLFVILFTGWILNTVSQIVNKHVTWEKQSEVYSTARIPSRIAICSSLGFYVYQELS